MKRRVLSLGFLVFMGGLVASASAVPITFVADLSGPNESPPNASPGTGFAVAVYDDLAQTLALDVTFSNLVGTTTVAHIHCCVDPPGNVGVAVTPGTLPGFPMGVTAGTYNVSIDLADSASYTASFVTNFGGGTSAGAESALVAGLMSSRAYFNIHTSDFPAGEIRGFFRQVPEPGTLALLLAGVLGGFAGRRRVRE